MGKCPDGFAWDIVTDQYWPADSAYMQLDSEQRIKLNRAENFARKRIEAIAVKTAEESLAVTCPHCGHTGDVRIPARFKPA